MFLKAQHAWFPQLSLLWVLVAGWAALLTADLMSRLRLFAEVGCFGFGGSTGEMHVLLWFWWFGAVHHLQATGIEGLRVGDPSIIKGLRVSALHMSVKEIEPC